MISLAERVNRARRGNSDIYMPLFLVAAVASVIGLAACSTSIARKHFMQKLYAQDSGTKIAYIADSHTIKVIPVENIDKKDATEYHPRDASIDALLWTSDGTSICYLNDIGNFFDTKHQIVKYDLASGNQTVLVDLTKEKFADNDISELRLDGQRVFFKLGTGEWYSVREDDPAVKRETKQADHDQTKCPHQTYSCFSKTPSKQSTQIFVGRENQEYSIGNGTKPVWSQK